LFSRAANLLGRGGQVPGSSAQTGSLSVGQAHANELTVWVPKNE